jgi:hypothetical protein
MSFLSRVKRSDYPEKSSNKFCEGFGITIDDFFPSDLIIGSEQEIK